MTGIYISKEEKRVFNVVLGERNEETQNTLYFNLKTGNWKNLVGMLEYKSHDYDINIIGDDDNINKTIAWYLTDWMFYNTPFKTNFDKIEVPVPEIAKKLKEASKKLHEMDW